MCLFSERSSQHDGQADHLPELLGAHGDFGQRPICRAVMTYGPHISLLGGRAAAQSLDALLLDKVGLS